MMKLLVLCALIGCSVALPNFNVHKPKFSGHSSDDAHAEVHSLRSDVREDGFEYALETTNGIRAQAQGDVHGNVHGSYAYTSPEGVPVAITYVADENGYQPQGDLLPTPPPIPEAILRALEYIRTHPPQEERSVHTATVARNFRPVPHGRHF